jgi:hypothetical protein
MDGTASRHPLATTMVLALALGPALGSLPAGAAIPDRVNTTTLTLPANLEPNRSNWCTWGSCSLSPRLYHAPLADGRTLVGWTDASLTGHVSVVSGASITTTFNFAGKPVRGLVGHDDGSFAVLLWDRGGSAPEDDVMWLSRRSATGVEQWAVRVTSTSNIPSQAGATPVGDSRLAHGGGVYGAYVSVHGVSGSAAGHEGEEYTRVSDAGSPVSGGWTWGLSHSMAELIAWHPESAALATVGSSDCYPGKGLYAGKSRLLWASDGDCAGRVQVQLGQMAAATHQRWLVAFNAVDRPGFPARGIGLARYAPTGSPTIVWLTNSAGTEERDPVLARLGSVLGSNRFLVGWRLQTSGEFRLAVVDTQGTLLEGPVAVSPAVKWGNRDDSFRTRPDGSVSWVQGDPGSSTLRLHRYADTSVTVEPPPLPTMLEVQPVFPNPFRDGIARIRFRLDVPRPVTVRVLDGAGRLVTQLHSGWLAAGPHELAWDRRDANGAEVAPGVYFCAVDAGGARSARKLAVTR